MRFAAGLNLDYSQTRPKGVRARIYPCRKSKLRQFTLVRLRLRRSSIAEPHRVRNSLTNMYYLYRPAMYRTTGVDVKVAPGLNVETHDPGQAPQEGGLLYARYGKGIYVYNAYAFYRQLPEGVPGAYRIFANLLSLGRSTRDR